MSKKVKDKKSSKGKEAPVKGEKKAVKKEAAVGQAKYDYPKNCTTDADKKKYRSLIRAGKEWEGPGASTGKAKEGKKSKKDPGNAKAVILDGKGKKIREEDVPVKKKKKESAED